MYNCGTTFTIEEIVTKKDTGPSIQHMGSVLAKALETAGITIDANESRICSRADNQYIDLPIYSSKDHLAEEIRIIGAIKGSVLNIYLTEFREPHTTEKTDDVHHYSAGVRCQMLFSGAIEQRTIPVRAQEVILQTYAQQKHSDEHVTYIPSYLETDT